jgi:WD40 repeat protein
MLATVSDASEVKLWDSASAKEIATLPGHTDQVWTAEFSPDGKTLATAGLDGLKLWDTVTHRFVTNLVGHTGGVQVAAFIKSGSLLVSHGTDNTIRLWDAMEHRQTAVIADPNNADHFAISIDGTILATGNLEGRVDLWAIPELRKTVTLKGHEGPVTALAFSRDGRYLATAADDNTTKVWDLATRKVCRSFEGIAAADVLCLAFSPDGAILAAGRKDGGVKLWSVAASTDPGDQFLDRIIALPQDRGIREGFFTFDGSNLLVEEWDAINLDALANCDLKIWDTQTLHLKGHRTIGWQQYVDLSKDQSSVIFVDHTDYSIREWNLSTLKERFLFKLPCKTGLGVSVAPRGNLLAVWDYSGGGKDPKVLLFDPRSGVGKGHLNTRSSNGVNQAAFSPDGLTIATSLASPGPQVLLWRVDSKTPLPGPPSGEVLRISRFVFSPDGSLLAIACFDHTIRLWNLRSGKVEILTGHADMVLSVAFSPDGRTLASFSRDKTVKLWNLPLRAEVATFREDLGMNGSVVFSPDGNQLLLPSAAQLENRLRLRYAAPLSIIDAK